MCKRPANNIYDCASFGNQHQGQYPWLQVVNVCLSKLAKTSTEARPQQGTLKVPWAWIARDLIQLLHANSCYRYLLKDDELFCHFLEQLTSDSVDNLSEPGAQMMAGILCQLAKQDPEALAEYIQASAAVLRRITDICSTLCNANRGSDAAEYAVDVAGCLLVHHRADVHSGTKQQAMKKLLYMLQLLPADLQSPACTKLVQSHQSLHAVLLRMEDLPEPMPHCLISLAVDLLERRSKSSKLSQKDAVHILESTIWAATPVYREDRLLKMIQLAVHANQLLQQVNTTRLTAKAVGKVRDYIQLMRQACEPNKLNNVLAGGLNQHVRTVETIIWVACLYTNTQQSKDPAAASSSNHQMHTYLLQLSTSIQTDAISMQRISQALDKLQPSVLTYEQLSTSTAGTAEPSLIEPPPAGTNKGKLTFFAI